MKVGDIISNYKVLEFIGKRGCNPYYMCECRNCGSVKPVAGPTLRQKTRARGVCSGCNSDKHYLYSTWKSMVNRCHNPNNSSYKYYGARGIHVCDSWRGSFWQFYEDMGDRSSGMTLDRINNNLGYEKSNCRWADSETQMNNRSYNLGIVYKGEVVTEAQLSRLAGVNRTSIQARRNRGIIRGEDLVNGLRKV